MMTRKRQISTSQFLPNRGSNNRAERLFRCRSTLEFSRTEGVGWNDLLGRPAALIVVTGALILNHLRASSASTCCCAVAQSERSKP